MKKLLIIAALLFLCSCSPSNPVPDDIECTEESPAVCAKVQVQCITHPCDPVLETFSNACLIKRRNDILDFVEGKCEINLKDPCIKDADCILPGDYAVRSICPYRVKCLDRECVVVCPDF